MSLQLLSEYKCFAGRQLRYQHQSIVNHCLMTFSLYLPPQAQTTKVPVLYWLSGLTCTDENFVTKAGAQRYAAEFGVAIVCPDTSPRGEGVPDDAEQAYDFGLGAGFYVNATEQPWQQHYQMYDYIVKELPILINENFPVDGQRISISGHSMGGHGALTIALKNSSLYRSVSAFAPICAPTQCPWGQKALAGYLGDEQSVWLAYDATELLTKLVGDKEAENNDFIPMLIDQGSADNFLVDQLKPDLLQQLIDHNALPANVRWQEGYDHSYFFISSFIGEHIAFHAKHLV